MTVLPVDNGYSHTLPRQNAAEFTASSRLLVRPGSRAAMQGSLSSVIPERKKPLPAFSGEGIRWDVWVTVLSLVLVLALCVLCIDIGALESGSRRIGKLTSGISSLEQRNSFLREEISDALSDPLLVFTAAKQETENREGSTTIMLSAGP